ncbi:MAG TPA: amino acid ABC transporter permease [Candidatus Limnocylindrales bacterium]|nr:amino acid ABC transporter permease [Candidatus Limnocylindrales bacterium]
MSGVAPTTPPELLGSRRSRLLGSLRPGGVLVAVASTVIVFGLIGYVVVTSPGWPRVQESFFNAEIFWGVLPDLVRALWKNIQLFLLAEVCILVLALLLAVMRSLPGPVFFPFRLMAVVYVDFFRGVPGVLVIFVLGLGIPGLRLPGVTSDPFVWGLVALTLLWSAYVAEVYRAGIESIHPSQEAAARSLGLTRVQGLRYVVLPQAVRRVIPPLLNDFIGLQKDTALVSFIGVIEVFRRTQIEAGGSFNFTPYVAASLLFLLLTIPLARFVDWLIARDRSRQMASMAR